MKTEAQKQATNRSSRRAHIQGTRQLGINAATASQRLSRDLLFWFVVQAGHRCYRCGGELTRETFSIEHKTPWLHSRDPQALYFDLKNIAWSHQSCNSAAARYHPTRPPKFPPAPLEPGAESPEHESNRNL